MWILPITLGGGGEPAAGAVMALKNDWAPGDSYANTNQNDVANAFNRLSGGVVQLDDFAGADDDAKLTAALTYAAAQTYIPAIQLPARVITFNTSGRETYHGMRIIGPFGADGPKNYAQTGGPPEPVNHKVVLNVGNGASAWFNDTNTETFGTLNIYFGNITFVEGNVNAQFLHAANGVGSLYGCHFHALEFYGFKHIFGTRAAPAVVSGSTFSGNWEVQNFRDTPFNLKGSDNTFWTDSWANIASSQTPATVPSPLIYFDFMAKTTIGKMYLSVHTGWFGLDVVNGSETTFVGTVIEGGEFDTHPTHGLMKFGWAGEFTFLNCSFNYADDTNANGVIEVTPASGDCSLTFYSPRYIRSNLATAAFPLIYQTGGRVKMYDPQALTSGENIRWRKSDGTTLVVPQSEHTDMGEQFATLTSTYTLTSQTAAQKLFNTSTNGAITLTPGTYFFECGFDLSSMSATSGSFGWTLGGSATIAGIRWRSEANKAALGTAASAQHTVNTAANTAIATASTSTTGWARITGKVRISAGGTVIPQVSLGVAAAAVVGVDSFFRIRPVGSNTATKVGDWS